MVGRRRVLGLLVATACVPRQLVDVSLPDGVRLGWRLIPGQQLTYDVVVKHGVGGGQVTRSERWTYGVVARTAGVATLHGHLVGLGGRIETAQPDHPGIDAALVHDRAQGAQAVLRMGVDGRLRPQPGLDCSALNEPDTACFGRQLAHRLLALPLPAEEVQTGRVWRDPDLARPFLPLLPRQLQPDIQGRCTVADIYLDPTDAPRVDLRSTLLVRAEGGMALRAEGLSTWDPRAGALARRTLHARLGGGLGPPVGDLSVTLTRRS